MKQLITLLLLTELIASPALAQDITGTWSGILKLPAMQLRIVLHINKVDTGLAATMDSPDQAANGIPVSSIHFEKSTLKFTMERIHVAYEGKLGTDNMITGTFTQYGQGFPLNLTKGVAEKTTIVRPQEPKPPYPYYSEDIIFENKQAGISLAGTLTLPKKDGVFPAVVLISGSGPQNRDEELLGHKPFLVLSDYLTRNGIAVLRFDDRGTGESKGSFKNATSFDFSTDAEAAVQYLQTRKEINKTKIGLMGHSEGGLIAPMIAARSNAIAFIVMLAGPGVPGDQLLLLQSKDIAKASGKSDNDIQNMLNATKKCFDMVKKSQNAEQLKTDLTAYLKEISKTDPDKPAEMSTDEYVNIRLSRVLDPWMIYFLKYDPVPALEKVKCPVLALNGQKDMQVPPKENLPAVEKALKKGGNKKSTVKELPGLNHLFQECKTGLPIEYANIDQTFSPFAMTTILQWIKMQ